MRLIAINRALTMTLMRLILIKYLIKSFDSTSFYKSNSSKICIKNDFIQTKGLFTRQEVTVIRLAEDIVFFTNWKEGYKNKQRITYVGIVPATQQGSRLQQHWTPCSPDRPVEDPKGPLRSFARIKIIKKIH